jgi:hypothetical protein
MAATSISSEQALIDPAATLQRRRKERTRLQFRDP